MTVDAVMYVMGWLFCQDVSRWSWIEADGPTTTLQRSRQTVTDLWEWMERPKWYRQVVNALEDDLHPTRDMTPEERTEWVKSLKRSHDESVRSTREEE